MQADDQLLSIRGRRVFLVGLALHGQPVYRAEEHLDELQDLAISAGCRVVGRALQVRRAPQAATFLGRGKAEEIAAALHEVEADLVVCDDDLSPSQVKNLERILEVPVIDRSILILQIFHLRARTREARTQVELARLHYLLPRLTRRWRHLSRQAGHTGLRGGEGEKQLEVDRRILRRRIGKLERELERIARTRKVQRRGREGVPVVALAGYTNVGKSTLFNRLTGTEDAAVRDKLFATLDPKLRRGGLDGRKVVVYADTVGLIRKLPHHLVASFKSTLEELLWADLVLHVIDRSHPQWREQKRVAEEVMHELGVERDRVLAVYNKVDRLGGSERSGADELWVSAISGEGIEVLQQAVARHLGLAGGAVEAAAATIVPVRVE